MSEWINLEERLPLPSQYGLFGMRRVIVFCRDGTRKFAMVRWKISERLRTISCKFYPLELNEYLSECGSYGDEIDNVTHWFDIPYTLECITSDDWIDPNTALSRCPSPMRCICNEIIEAEVKEKVDGSENL